MRNKWSILRLALACVFAAVPYAVRPAVISDAAAADPKPPSEYFVKALYLYNFTKFVQWPGDYAVGKNPEINICVTGKDPFGNELTNIEKASTATLKLNVLRGVSESQFTSCHVLFIGASEESRIDAILAKTAGQPILTVSEVKNFAERGGNIGFVNVEQAVGLFSKEKLKLEVNRKAATGSHLKIDANLLQIAAKVID